VVYRGSLAKVTPICINFADKVGSSYSVSVNPPQPWRGRSNFFEEKLYFSPGDTGFKVWDTKIGRIGIMICFDWFFPESMRSLALLGADIIAHPSNLVLPYCPQTMPVF